MADAQPLPTTQRAYTLRLKRASGKCSQCGQDNCFCWRDALWATHEAVNRGAQAFGDWLLTLRGGLDHSLADAKIAQGKNKPGCDPTDEECKARRILLALSWLSVESERGAPSKYLVPHDFDQQSKTRSNWKTVDALKDILQKRGLGDPEIDAWVQDCSASLTAAIRDDAVWVNRSQAFDDAVKSIGSPLTRDEVWDMLERFFGSKEAYLTPTTVAEDEPAGGEQEEKAKDLVQKAGQWLSSRFGTGEGADFSRMADVYNKIAEWADQTRSAMPGNTAIANLAATLSEFSPKSNDLQGVLGLISGPGYKSATRNLLKQLANKNSVNQQDLASLKDTASKDTQKCRQNTGSKGQRPYADAILKDVQNACGFTYLQNRGPARHREFAVMLDHAARRVSLAHTWIKRAEAERRRFDNDAKKMDNVPGQTKNWLDGFCKDRSEAAGSVNGYRIRRRAIDGWKEVVAAWSKDMCETEDDRIAAARLLQDDPEIDKFGDIQLFEALAEDDALCVWHQDGDTAKTPDPQPLMDYVLATEAEFKRRRFKVPAYRHPDALLHPVFCDFGNSRWDIDFAVHRNRDNFSKVHEVTLALWDKKTIQKNKPLRWSCKRLFADLALAPTGSVQRNGPSVSRADRLGCAAVGVANSKAVRIAGLFDQKYWNGRLQAPRSQLNEIARHVDRHGWDDKAKKMLARIRWLLSFSAPLVQQGPWLDFCQRFDDDAPARPFISRRGEYAVAHADNDKRKGHAKLILSRLPGLRVLSVDLGHRFAAACAVWETLTAKQMSDACRAARHADPNPEDLFLHLKTPGDNDKQKTVIYRRIGPDTLPDGNPHPAPWARLDRQFLIKLQGEDRAVRKASPAEIAAVEEFENAVGRQPPERRSLQIDELMSEAVRAMRLALQRHGRRARIAFNLTTNKKLLPGGREENLNPEERVVLLADTLADWYALFAGKGWTDPWAEQQWQTHITPMLQGVALSEFQEDGEPSAKARKKHLDDLKEKLKPVAERLAQDALLCENLHDLWDERWRADDSALQKRLRWLRDWLLPRGKKAKANRAIRHVGGLSLTRIATIKSLYQVQKAFHMRPEPDNPRKNIPAKGDDALRDFGRSILDVMEHLREQRVKQLASRIVEAALGVGRIRIPKKGKMPKRPRDRVDQPCHAVVIENLTHYRPEETRTRRENRQLMSWASGKVKKYLAEACQLHGLHLREVSAAYTSRQDSRTGAPGIRCQDVPLREFMQSPFWRKQVAQAEKKLNESKGNSRERFLCDLNVRWKDKPEADWRQAGTLRLPLQGGDIFISADEKSPAAKGLQADLNAAANIGLRALMDPDFPAKWWFIPCDPKTKIPIADKVKGSIVENIGPLQAVADSDAQKTSKRKRSGRSSAESKQVVNLWHDLSATNIRTAADGDSWHDWTKYWNMAENKVVRLLR
jgi:IS605 OrfB family transposase